MLMPSAQAHATMIGRIGTMEAYAKPIPRCSYVNDEAAKTDIAVGMPDWTLQLPHGDSFRCGRRRALALAARS